MPRPTALVVAATALLTVSVSVSAADSNCTNSLQVSYPAPVAADGWAYQLVATNLTRPRGILFDTEGGIIIVDSTVGLVHFTLKDDGGTCVEVDEKKTLVENPDLNHGLALSEDGKTVYASTSNDVYSWPYSATDVSLTSSSRRTLVTNMNNTGHVSRTLLLSKKYPDLLLVARGSAGNDDDGAADKSTGRSQIRAFNITALGENDDPYDYLDGDLLGWGLRNSVGVAEHPADGGIWSVENSVDQLKRNGKDIHADNPGEELNFHGYLNGSKEDQGGNYGYPHCVSVWSTDKFPDKGDLETGDQFPLDRSDSKLRVLTDDQCVKDYVPPVLAFQAHMAPLDIKFTEDGSEAYITFHGSWNRDDPVGYQIDTVSFEDGRPSDPSTSMDSTTTILKNPDNSECPDECFRPVGLAWDSNGRLWFTSDATGEIFVMQNADGTNSANGGDSGSQSGDDDSAATTYLPGKSVLAVTFAAAVMGFFLA
ncbi:Fc.00g061450.m01.CDS01 [Cosmosporella sp. VM-42]